MARHHARPPGLARDRIVHLVKDGPLLWLPAKQLPRADGLAARVPAPGEGAPGEERVGLVERDGDDGSGSDEALGVGGARDGAAHVAPDEVARLGEVVALGAPGGRRGGRRGGGGVGEADLAAAGGLVLDGRVDEAHVQVAQVPDVHVVPVGLARADHEALAAQEDGARELVQLHAALVSPPAARPVDGRRSDDGRLDVPVRVVGRGGEHDLVDGAVRGRVRHLRRHLREAIPVVEDLGRALPDGLVLYVGVHEHVRAGGVDQMTGLRRGQMRGETLDEGSGGPFMVCVGEV